MPWGGNPAWTYMHSMFEGGRSELGQELYSYVSDRCHAKVVTQSQHETEVVRGRCGERRECV